MRIQCHVKSVTIVQKLRQQLALGTFGKCRTNKNSEFKIQNFCWFYIFCAGSVLFSISFFEFLTYVLHCFMMSQLSSILQGHNVSQSPDTGCVWISSTLRRFNLSKHQTLYKYSGSLTFRCIEFEGCLICGQPGSPGTLKIQTGDIGMGADVDIEVVGATTGNEDEGIEC